jgi:hypothetical protein
MRGAVRISGWPDRGEVVSLLVLAMIGIWGAWFGVQSLFALWWPLNVIYLLAGVGVAAIAAAVGRAIMSR